MNVLIALLGSIVRGITTPSQLGLVHLAIIVHKVPELTCLSPMDICALRAISVPDKLQNQKSVAQVCECRLKQMNIRYFFK